MIPDLWLYEINKFSFLSMVWISVVLEDDKIEEEAEKDHTGNKVLWSVQTMTCQIVESISVEKLSSQKVEGYVSCQYILQEEDNRVIYEY